MNGYKAFFAGAGLPPKDIYAETKLAALQKALEHFKPSKSKRHMVIVELAETDVKNGKGQQVTTVTT